MDDNKFFKFIWRANALILFAVALLALGAMIFAVWLDMNLNSNNFEKPPVQMDVENQSNNPKQDLKISKTSVKFGEDSIFLELEKPGYSGGSLSYSRSITYNVGIYSLVTNQTNWIFPTNNQEIRTTKHFRKTETLQNGDTKNTVIGHLFSSLTTGKDGEIHRDIWVTDINGNDRREILTDVDDEPEIWYYGDNKAKLIFETDKRVQLVDFDLFTREIGKTVIIQPPE